MTRNFENIPADLRLLPQWVCWRLEKRDAKDTKVPYQPNGRKANASDPATWSNFAEVVAACANGKRFNGIGFVFAKGGDYVGIDFDKHRDLATGKLDEFAGRHVQRLASYTEVSPSGTGVHVIVRATLPSETGRRDAKKGVEMYSHSRFFCMTGLHVEGTPLAIETPQPEVEEMFRKIFLAKKQRHEMTGATTPPPAYAELIKRASKATNGARFSALYRGDRKGAGYGSQSEADAALLSMLRFWTGGDKERSFRLFAQSGLTLLPNGYHAETETLTLASVDCGLDMPLNAAVGAIDDLLAEFHFADGERSRAVSVAAMVGLFANQLLPEKSLRPCFIFVANAEGAGKSTLARICIAPTLGAMPTGCKSNEDEEIRKFLLTAIREGCLVIFFDNFKGKLSSPALESFLSAPVWSDRKLGVSETVTGDNLATCFVTGNGMPVSPDMRRRSLFTELHLEAERAEDKKFMRDLELPQILEMRPKILAALWAIVRHWDQQGRPAPSRGHSAFPSWANIIGGIVEAAGFACPLQTANVTAIADADGEDMRRLVSEMANRAAPCTFAELIELAREHGLFESIIGTGGEELGRREKSAFSKLLGRYDRRRVLNHRLIADGKGKSRRYKVEVGNGGHGRNGVSDEKTSLYARELGRKDHSDHADHAKPAPTGKLL